MRHVGTQAVRAMSATFVRATDDARGWRAWMGRSQERARAKDGSVPAPHLVAWKPQAKMPMPSSSARPSGGAGAHTALTLTYYRMHPHAAGGCRSRSTSVELTPRAFELVDIALEAYVSLRVDHLMRATGPHNQQEEACAVAHPEGASTGGVAGCAIAGAEGDCRLAERLAERDSTGSSESSRAPSMSALAERGVSVVHAQHPNSTAADAAGSSTWPRSSDGAAVAPPALPMRREHSAASSLGSSTGSNIVASCPPRDVRSSRGWPPAGWPAGERDVPVDARMAPSPCEASSESSWAIVDDAAESAGRASDNDLRSGRGFAVGASDAVQFFELPDARPLDADFEELPEDCASVLSTALARPVVFGSIPSSSSESAGASTRESTNCRAHAGRARSDTSSGAASSDGGAEELMEAIEAAIMTVPSSQPQSRAAPIGTQMSTAAASSSGTTAPIEPNMIDNAHSFLSHVLGAISGGLRRVRDSCLRRVLIREATDGSVHLRNSAMALIIAVAIISFTRSSSSPAGRTLLKARVLRREQRRSQN